MEIIPLAKEGGSFIARYLPRMLARRIFTHEKLGKEISFGLRDVAPLQIAGTPARLTIWFRFVNHSSLDVRVDRLVVDAWFSQPTAQLAILVPFDVPARSEVNNVLAQLVLSNDLVRYVSQIQEMQGAKLYLYASAVCMTSVRSLTIQQTIERDVTECKLMGVLPKG